MELDEIVRSRKEEILRLAAKHGAHNVRLFGSAVRGDAGPESDVDFLVEFENGRSLLDLSGLWLDLEQLLGRKVDVAQPQTLHWYIRDRVLKEAIPL